MTGQTADSQAAMSHSQADSGQPGGTPHQCVVPPEPLQLCSPPATVAGKSKHPNQLNQQRPVDSELIKHRSLKSLYDVPESGGRREAWGNLLARATSKRELE